MRRISMFRRPEMAGASVGPEFEANLRKSGRAIAGNGFRPGILFAMVRRNYQRLIWSRRMKRTFFAALFALTPALFASSAQADVIDFSYLFPENGNVVSGSMNGTLLSDGNVFDVSSFVALFVNGVAAETPTFIEGPDQNHFGGGPAAVSLDGSYLNLDAEDATDVLLFAVNDAAAVGLGGTFAGASPGYGGSDFAETYVPGNWTASLESVPVPEPSSILLMLVPLALLASTRRVARRSV
jgi:hypothetical protein